MSKDGLVVEAGVARCFWAGSDPLYQRYHDEEWGFPDDPDHRLFEKLSLEGFQSGLSWLTILKKRENFRRAFKDFHPAKVAKFTEADVTRLLGDASIVRHRKKIEAVIHNAPLALALIEERGSLADYFWSFEPPAAERPKRMTKAALSTLAKTPTSARLARDLKARGFRFIGPTTAYAFMQAMGMVNDHMEGCHVRDAVDLARAARA